MFFNSHSFKLLRFRLKIVRDSITPRVIRGIQRNHNESPLPFVASSIIRILCGAALDSQRSPGLPNNWLEDHYRMSWNPTHSKDTQSSLKCTAIWTAWHSTTQRSSPAWHTYKSFVVSSERFPVPRVDAYTKIPMYTEAHGQNTRFVRTRSRIRIA